MRYFPALAILSLFLFASSGCAATQQWLQPRVCDCETAVSCDAQSAEVAHAVAHHQVDSAHYRAETDGAQAARARSESDEEDNEQDEAWYRSAEELANEPIDPTEPDSAIALDDEEAQQEFEARFGIDVAAPGAAFRGNFQSLDSSSIAVHRPGEAVEIYSGNRLKASLSLEDFDSVSAPDDVTRYAVGAIDLVPGRTAQLKIIHTETSDNGEVTYHLGIYKLIDEFVGTAFRKPIARRADDGSVQRLADLRFLQGIDHRVIEWIPLNEQGEPEGETIRYEWNHWEGVYRVPKPPPTAPSEPRS